MKKSVFALAATAVAAAVLTSGCGQKAANASSDTIRMITEATFPPYEFREGTEVVGIDVEICRAIAAKLGKKLAIEDVEFDSVLPSLIANKAELAAAGITVNEDRKKMVDFSDPYVTTGIVIISPKDKAVKGAADAKGKRIGVQNGTTSADYSVEKLGQEPDRFDSPASAFAALKAGKVDLVIADVDPAENLVKQDGGTESAYAITSEPRFLTSEDYAIAIKKGQPELLATINSVIAELKASGKLQAIFDEYKAKADALVEKEEAAAKPAETVAEAAEKAVEKVEKAADAVAEKTAEVAEKASDAAEKAAEKATEVVEKAADAAKALTKEPSSSAVEKEAK